MRLTRRGRLTGTLTVVTVLLLVGAYAVTRTRVGTVVGVTDPPPCTITIAGETREWSRDTAMTATTVAGVGQRIGATLNGIAAALERTIGSGKPLTAAQARSAYRLLPERPTPGPASLALARAVLGYDGGVLACTVESLNLANRTGDELPRDEPGPLGLTPRADAVRVGMRDVFGKQTLGGFSPEGVTDGHIDGSSHYAGRAIDIFFRPITPENRRRGWLLAHWLVAHAEQLQIRTVIFDARIWTSRQSLLGWRDYRHPDGPTDNPILLHRDHVHVDVRRAAAAAGADPDAAV